MIREITLSVSTATVIAGSVVLTAIDKLPPEVMTGVIMTIITYVFKERETNQVRKSWERWSKEHNEHFHQNNQL